MGLASRSIYVIDDDDGVRASVLSLLSTRSDLLIRGFRSGDAFLEQADELDPAVLLLDQHMPGSTGLEILAALKRYSGRYAAIMLTGRGDIGLAVSAMKAGAYDFLEKPYEPANLLTLIDAAFVHREAATLDARRALAAESKLATLSPRETDVLKGLIVGRANKVIAHELDISARTVEIYRANMMDKLGVRSLSEALRIAFAAGLFPVD